MVKFPLNENSQYVFDTTVVGLYVALERFIKIHDNIPHRLAKFVTD
ncbi:MAG: hypothetical protein LBB21_00575 [Holosporaceae bacterium]|nr:hypothetical protein [Holosporaceae bacterium]